jgi:hypothetical protein
VFEAANMVFSKADRVLIQELRTTKGYGAKRLIKEFQAKNWSLTGLNRLLKNIVKTGNAQRKHGGGARRTSRTDENVASVEALIMSQEDQPGTHRSIHQIARETVIAKSAVLKIVHKDTDLKWLRKKQLNIPITS